MGGGGGGGGKKKQIEQKHHMRSEGVEEGNLPKKRKNQGGVGINVDSCHSSGHESDCHKGKRFQD